MGCGEPLAVPRYLKIKAVPALFKPVGRSLPALVKHFKRPDTPPNLLARFGAVLA